ncbi:MAG: S1/P1 nuclease [Acidobacteriota bacterium]
MPARAWGPIGHRTVAKVAENHLTAKTRREVAKLIGPQTLPEIAYWADEIRYLPERKISDTWHYISIDDTESITSTVRNPAGDVLDAIERMEKTLRDPASSRDQRVEALKFLVHFVGDVHQPLHVGRRADAGGNKIDVILNGQKENLHWVWDAIMLNDMGMSYTELAHAIDHPSAQDVASWQRAKPVDWVSEVFALRPQVYDGVPEDGKLSYLYSFKNWPLLRAQLLKAGVRLAGELNAIFDPRHAGR